MTGEVDGASKGLLGAFVVFVLGSGITTLVYGILLLLRNLAVQYSYGAFNLYLASIVLIVIGGLLILTVLLGVYGVWKDLASVRLVALVLALIVVVGLVGIGAWSMFIMRSGRLQNSIDADVRSLNTNYKGLKGEDQARADFLNRHYNCCGSYESYTDVTITDGVPDSCCIVQGCKANAYSDVGQYFEKGCRAVYSQAKAKEIFQLSVVTLATGGATLLGLILYAVIYQRRAHAGYAGVSRG